MIFLESFATMNVKQIMEVISIVWILAFLGTVKGFKNTTCYFIYQPLLNQHPMAGSYDIIIDINITKLNISLNDAAPEEVALCDNSVSCCRTSFRFSFDNETSDYVQACTNVDVQLYVSPVNGSMYQASTKKELGKKYYVVCPSFGIRCSVVVGFVEDNANITVKFSNESLTYNLTMGDSEILSTNHVDIILSPLNRSVVFTCNCDLTGVFIQSNATIALFSLTHHSLFSSTTFPLPPMEMWDTQYSLVAMKDSNVDESVIIMTSERNSYIKVSGQAIVNVPTAGSYMYASFGTDIILDIKASYPVMVVHVGNLVDIDTTSVISIFPPLKNEKMCLTFDNVSTSLHFIFQEDTGSVDINCSNLSITSSNATNTTLIYRTDTHVTIGATDYILSKIIINPSSIGCQMKTTGLVYGYAYTLDGSDLQVYTVGNGIHNKTAEDYSIPSSLYNTDPTDDSTDSYGKHFVIMQPMNCRLKVFISCKNFTNVTVTQTGNNIINQAFICNDTELSYGVVVNITNNNSQLIKIDSSEEEMSVYVTGLTSSGLFSYLALPVNVLGYEYMVVSFFNITELINGQRSCCYGTILYNATNIAIKFRPGMTSVLYNGNTVHGTGIDINLDEYQMFSFESSTTDMTGVYVKSNKPIELYCGGHSNNSIFYEQLIPTNALGFRFVLHDMTNLNEFKRCFYRLVASDVNTEIEIDDLNGLSFAYNASRSEYLDLPPTTCEVTSNLGLTVVLICIASDGDISFSLVPSNKQRKAEPPKPADDSFTEIKLFKRIMFYRDDNKVASHISAMKVTTIACPFTKVGTSILDTSDCFYGDGGGGNGDKTGCKCSSPPRYTPSNLTLKEKIDELVKVLTIDKTTLSSYKNARISAPDPRPSARGIGSVAAALLSTLVVVLLISDLPLIILHLKLMKANFSGGFHRFCVKQQ